MQQLFLQNRLEARTRLYLRQWRINNPRFFYFLHFSFFVLALSLICFEGMFITVHIKILSAVKISSIEMVCNSNIFELLVSYFRSTSCYYLNNTNPVYIITFFYNILCIKLCWNTFFKYSQWQII